MTIPSVCPGHRCSATKTLWPMSANSPGWSWSELLAAVPSAASDNSVLKRLFSCFSVNAMYNHMIINYYLDKWGNQTIYWRTKSSSSFYLFAEKTLVKHEEELLTFDSGDLLNGLGGALGLFLGWSLLHICNECYKLAIRDNSMWMKLYNYTHHYYSFISVHHCVKQQQI